MSCVIEPSSSCVCLIDGVSIKPGKAFDTLKTLAIQKRLPYPFDPLEGEIVLEVEGDEDGAIVCAKVDIGKRIPLEKCTVYSKFLILDTGVLHLTDCDIPDTWFEKLKSGPIMLIGEEYAQFCDDCGLAKPKQKRATILDHYGALLKGPLEDCGYTKAGEHLQSSTLEASKKIKALIKNGWVVTKNGKPVIPQTNFTLDIIDCDDHIEVDGTISFNDQSAQLAHTPFIDLGSSVGLVDRSTLDEIAALPKTMEKTAIGCLASPSRPIKALLPKIAEWIDATPSQEFKGKLHPYQYEGLSYLDFWRRANLGGILADEMGLGKTVQVLALFSRIQSCRPTLIVVPTSLIQQWQMEFKRFLPGELYAYYGPERSIDRLKYERFSITTYGMLIKGELSGIDFEMVVLDEANAIKNASSQTFKAATALSARSRIALTGTPIENRIDELWAIMQFCVPNLKSKSEKAIQPFILRRTKDQVGIDLPSKIEQDIYITLSEEEKTYYADYEQALRQRLINKGDQPMEILEGILRLRQICAHPQLIDKPWPSWSKFERLIFDIEELALDGHKVLVYSQFTSVLDLIENELKSKEINHLRLDGGTKNRADLVNKYQTDPRIPVFLISLKAGGVGLNLTAADYVLIFDPWWNAAVEAQAISRAHRLGRQSSVIARRYYACDTIETKMQALKQQKLALTDTLPKEPALDDLYNLIH